MLGLAAVVAVGTGVALRQTGATRRTEQSTIDLRFKLRGHVALPADIALVAIDAQTFNYFRAAKLPSQWPFPRRYYARVIDNLHRAGARVIAVDIQFTEPTDLRDDYALYNALSPARPVVLGTSEVSGHGQTAILGGNANLSKVGATPGDTNFRPDSDGVIRRMRYSIQGLDTFPVAVAEAFTGRPVPDGAFGGGSVPIDFAYPAGKVPTVSLWRVWSGHFDPAQFRVRIVFVGATAPTLQDIHETPNDPVMPGVELQANATGTVLQNLPLRDAPGALDLALIVVLGLLAPLVSLRLRRLRTLLLGAVGLGAAYGLAAQLAFSGGTIVDVVDPLSALAIATVGSLAVLEVVNRYLELMTAAILAAGGTLIAFMGDGIMALFGAPLEQPDHADRAPRAAREMLEAKLTHFNEWMLAQGHSSGFRMGIGLHSGLVMAGNVGSDERLDYTAIGDTTNTASRLEGMTKQTEYMLLTRCCKPVLRSRPDPSSRSRSPAQRAASPSVWGTARSSSPAD